MSINPVKKSHEEILNLSIRDQVKMLSNILENEVNDI